MAKIDYIQNSFAVGEIGDSLQGRSDLDQYRSACAVVENMIVRPYGSAISAPGSEYIAACSVSTTKTRLIPFVFNRAQAYAIEMGVGYFRFLTRSGLVVTTGTTVLDVPHTYTEAELFEVQYTQLNDVVYLFHKSHPIQRLIRMSASYWKLEVFDLECSPFLDDNITTTQIWVGASTGTTTITASTAIFTPSTSSTRGHYKSFFKIGATTTDSTTGLTVQGYVQIDSVDSTTHCTVTIKQTLTITPSTSTIDWAEGAWSGDRGFPSCGVFYDSRLAVARTNHEPQKIWLSKSYIYDDFALDGANADDALNIQPASNESNEIQWLVAGGSLIAGTFGGEFVINGGGENALTPSNVTIKKQSSWGSEPIIPKRIGNYFYYIQRYGRKLRELFYFWDLDSYKSADRTIFSPDVLGNGVVDMAYQQNPDTIMWCVRTDGSLALMTREIDQEMTAWSRITVGDNSADDKFESICSIPAPSGDDLYDQVWVVAKRNITETNGTTKVVRYIELFKTHDIPARQDMCWYLQSALRYNAYATTSSSSASISLSATDGTSVIVTSSTAYFNADDVNQRIRAVDIDGATIGEMKITSYGSTTIVAGEVRYPFDSLNYNAGSWGTSVNTITGLSHLEGVSVGVLADGGFDKPAKTVSLGAISLAYDYFVVLVGIPYTQKLQTLPPEAGSQRGTSQGKIQRINQIAFKVNRSFKGFKTGGTEALAEKTQFRDPTTLMGTREQLYSGIVSNIVFRSDYVYGASAWVINEEPLPIELLNIIKTVDTQDK